MSLEAGAEVAPGKSPDSDPGAEDLLRGDAAAVGELQDLVGEHPTIDVRKVAVSVAGATS